MRIRLPTHFLHRLAPPTTRAQPAACTRHGTNSERNLDDLLSAVTLSDGGRPWAAPCFLVQTLGQRPPPCCVLDERDG